MQTRPGQRCPGMGFLPSPRLAAAPRGTAGCALRCLGRELQLGLGFPARELPASTRQKDGWLRGTTRGTQAWGRPLCTRATAVVTCSPQPTRGPRRPPCSGRSLRLSSPASSLLRLGPRPLSRQLLWVTCGLSAGHLWVIRSLSQVLHVHLYQEDLAQSFYQKAAYLKRLTTTAAQTFPGLSQCRALF